MGFPCPGSRASASRAKYRLEECVAFRRDDARAAQIASGPLREELRHSTAKEVATRKRGMAEHRVVVVGAGFAGLKLAHDLRRAPVRITIIDQRNHHLFQPLLYQVATTLLATSEIAWPIRRLFRDRPEVTTLLGQVRGVDRVGRRVLFRDGGSVPYDTLVLATGARHAYFGHDEWEPSAPGLKTLEDATTIRRRLLLAFEHAEREPDPERRRALMTFCIIGGGPTGVELTGIIAELAQKVLPREFRNIDTRQTRVLLVEAGPRVLPAFTREALGLCRARPRPHRRRGAVRHAGHHLRRQRHQHRRPLRAGPHRDLGGGRAGVERGPLARGARRPGRPGHRRARPNGAGHCRRSSRSGTPPMSSPRASPSRGSRPAAKQQGAYVARVIRARLAGRPAPGPFRYRHLGNLATVGRSSAVIDFGRVKLKGWLAWWIWGIAHIYFLIGTRSRHHRGDQLALVVRQRSEQRPAHHPEGDAARRGVRHRGPGAGGIGPLVSDAG